MSEHAHPTDRQYIKIGTILFILTALEVALYFVEDFFTSDWSFYLLVGTLVFLSTIKFILVVMYFMHLKFDDRILTWFFVAGMGVAAAIFFAMLAMFHFY